MNRKKVFLLLVSFVMMSLFSNVVFASNHPDGVGAGLGDAFDTIRELFAFLPELVTLEKLIGGTDEAAKFWARFLVWVLLFAVFFFGASKVFPDNKRIAVIVSLVIALMGTLLIPYSILVNIFQTYGLVAGIIVWTIPLIAGMFIAHKIENPFARAVIYGVSAWILFSINKTVVEVQGFANTNFPFFGILLAIVIILFVVNVAQIFGALGGGGVGGAVGGWAADRGRSFGDWMRGRGDDRGPTGGGPRGGGPEDEDERRARELTRREQQMIDRFIRTDANSLNTDIKIRDYLQKLKDYLDKEEFGLRLAEILPNLRKVKDVVGNRERRDRQVMKIIDRNRTLLNLIVKTLKEEEGHTEEDLKKELRSALDGRNKLGKKHVAVLKKLLDDEKRADYAARIEAYLDNVIEKEDKERIELFEKIDKHLENVMIELQNETPKIEVAKDDLHDAIYYIEEVVKIDRNIIKREKEMYRQNRFLQHILSEEAAETGGTPPG